MSQLSFTFNILFLGDSNVGKTAFIDSYLKEGYKFQEHTLPTFHNGLMKETKSIDRNEHKILFQLHDTAGQERYRSMTPQMYKHCDGIALLYDITSEKTFANISEWLSNITDNTSKKDIAIALVGNKCDLKDERKIDKEKGEKMAKDNDLLFFESSVKEKINITEIMNALADQLMILKKDRIGKMQLKQEQKKEEPSGCCSSSKSHSK